MAYENATDKTLLVALIASIVAAITWAMLVPIGLFWLCWCVGQWLLHQIH